MKTVPMPGAFGGAGLFCEETSEIKIGVRPSSRENVVENHQEPPGRYHREGR